MQEALQQINLYTDGAVKMPVIKHFALGGYGLWWPVWTVNQLQQRQAHDLVREYLTVEEWDQCGDVGTALQ